MALKLIYGPANSGKTGYAYKEWTGKQKSGLAPVLILPTLADVERAKIELCGRSGFLLGGNIQTFNSFIFNFLNEQNTKPDVVSYIEKLAIVQAVVAGKKLDALKKSASHMGFYKSLLGQFDEFSKEGLEPYALRKFAAVTGALSKHRKQVIEEVSDIFESFSKALKNLGKIEQAAEELAVANAIDGRRLKQNHLIIHKFEDFTKAQRIIIERAAENTELTATFPFEKNRGVFLSLKPAFDWLTELSGQVIELEAKLENYGEKSLYCLERNIFSGTKDKLSCANTIQILVSAGTDIEVESVANEIAGLLNEGFKPGEIVVTASSLAPYADSIERIFLKFNLPFSADRNKKVAHTQFGYSLFSLLKWQYGKENINGFLAFLKSPFSGIDKGLFFEIEAEALACLPEKFDFLIKNNKSLKSLDLARKRGGLFLNYDELKHILKTIKDMSRNAKTINKEDITSADWITRELTRVFKIGEISGFKFGIKQVINLLAQIEFRGQKEREVSHVQVIDLLKARSRRFKVAFILGLNDRVFPKIESENAFLFNSERQDFNRLNGQLFHIPDYLSHEKYLFYSAITRPRNRLYLSYQACDEEGKQKLRSFFVNEAERVFDKKIPKKERLLWQVAPPLENTYTLKDRLLAASLAENKIINLPVMHQTLLEESKNGKPAKRGLRSSFSLQNINRLEEISVNSLQDLTKCPFAWFINAQIKPNNLIPDNEYHKKLGTVTHISLSKLYKNAPEQLTERSPAQDSAENWIARAKKLIENDSEVIRELSLLDSINRLKLTNEAIKLIVTAIDFDMENGPAGPKLCEEKVETFINVEGKDIKIKGRVDRIDQQDGGYLIVDYKTGKGGKELGPENNIQLQLYCKALQEKGTDIKQAYFLCLRNKKKFSLSQSELADRIKAAEDISNQAISLLFKGDLGVKPADKCPRYCDFYGFCEAKSVEQ
jgi:ATP-dependent helicase/DNAse subunit B